MTGPIVQHDPDQEHGAANQFHVLAADFNGQPDDVDGDGPDQRATKNLQDQMQRTGRNLGHRLGDTGDKLRDSTDSAQATDKANAQQLSPKDYTGMLSDVGGLLLSSTVPFATEAASFAGQAASIAASTTMQTIQQGTGAAKNTGNTPPSNAGIGLPPANQDAGRPDSATHPASATTPLGPPRVGGQPVGAPGDRARTEAQDRDHPTVMPAGMMMPMMRPMGIGGGGGNPSPGKVTGTKHIVTEKEEGA